MQICRSKTSSIYIPLTDLPHTQAQQCHKESILSHRSFITAKRLPVRPSIQNP